MIMWRRWKNGRGLELQWRDSSGITLLRRALMGRVRSSNISGVSKLEPRVVPCHNGNTVLSLGPLAQSARFFSLTAASLVTFFGHESSDVGLSFCISRRRRHRERG